MGNKYGDLKSVAEKNGLSQATFYKRIKNGHTPEEAASGDLKLKCGRKYSVGSLELSQLAEKNGIKKSTYYARLRNGWNKRRAATEPVRKQYITKRHQESQFDVQEENNGVNRTRKDVH